MILWFLACGGGSFDLAPAVAIDESPPFESAPCRTVMEMDDDGDDLVDLVYTTTVSLTGRVVEQTSDYGADGAIDRWSLQVERENSGIYRSWEDWDHDGQPTSTCLHRYGPEGRILQWWCDDVRYAYDWSDDGRLLAQRMDEGLDGVFEHDWRWTHADDGRTLRLDDDTDGDGLADASKVWTWDGERLMGWDDDADGDGVADRTERNGWDGDVMRWSEWTWDQGGPVRQRIEWTDDHQWALLLEDVDGDGRFDHSQANGYDADGRIVRASVDEGLDGTIDSEAIYIWDADGRIASWTWVQAGEPALWWRTTYAWDRFGRPVRQEVDSGDDGTVDQWWAWTYDCAL